LRHRRGGLHGPGTAGRLFRAGSAADGTGGSTSPGFWAVYPTTRLVPSKVRVFIATPEAHLRKE
jgi:hypothetical protein